MEDIAPATARPSAGTDRPTTVIEAGGSHARYLAEAWRLRNLLVSFAWRDIVLRYRHTVAGVLWVTLRPLLTMAVFSIVFGRFLKIPSPDVPYPLLVLTGLMAWQFIAYSVAGATESLFAYGGVLSKVYFPRILVPLAAITVNLVDLGVTALLMVPFMLYYGVLPDWRAITLPLFILAAIPAAAGLGIWFSALAVRFRDFRNVVPFVVQLSLYLSPVCFPTRLVPEQWQFVYWLNPIVGAVEGVRWALLGGKATLNLPGMGVSFALSIVLLWTGYRYFRNLERSMVDIL